MPLERGARPGIGSRGLSATRRRNAEFIAESRLAVPRTTNARERVHEMQCPAGTAIS